MSGLYAPVAYKRAVRNKILFPVVFQKHVSKEGHIFSKAPVSLYFHARSRGQGGDKGDPFVKVGNVFVIPLIQNDAGTK